MCPFWVGVSHLIYGDDMITEYVAKPNLNNNMGIKTFSLENEAIKYLEEYTGYQMSFEKNKKTGEKVSDWYLIDKLVKVEK